MVATPSFIPAAATVIEDLAAQPQTRWRFFADTVMGGVSSGQFVFLQEQGAYARMTGHVGAANTGGFIQMRMDLAPPPPEETAGVPLIVRGDDQRYVVHLRTRGALSPRR